jgi:hypothetical protein
VAVTGYWCRWFDSAPGHHFHFLEAHGFSGITGGPSARAGARNRPTIGLREIGSADDARVSRRTSRPGPVGDRVGPGVAASDPLGRRPWRPPWPGGARPGCREGRDFGGCPPECSRTHVPQGIAVRL